MSVSHASYVVTQRNGEEPLRCRTTTLSKLLLTEQINAHSFPIYNGLHLALGFADLIQARANGALRPAAIRPSSAVQ